MEVETVARIDSCRVYQVRELNIQRWTVSQEDLRLGPRSHYMDSKAKGRGEFGVGESVDEDPESCLVKAVMTLGYRPESRYWNEVRSLCDLDLGWCDVPFLVASCVVAVLSLAATRLRGRLFLTTRIVRLPSRHGNWGLRALTYPGNRNFVRMEGKFRVLWPVLSMDTCFAFESSFATVRPLDELKHPAYPSPSPAQRRRRSITPAIIPYIGSPRTLGLFSHLHFRLVPAPVPSEYTWYYFRPSALVKYVTITTVFIQVHRLWVVMIKKRGVVVSNGHARKRSYPVRVRTIVR